MLILRAYITNAPNTLCFGVLYVLLESLDQCMGISTIHPYIHTLFGAICCWTALQAFQRGWSLVACRVLIYYI